MRPLIHALFAVFALAGAFAPEALAQSCNSDLSGWSSYRDRSAEYLGDSCDGRRSASGVFGAVLDRLQNVVSRYRPSSWSPLSVRKTVASGPSPAAPIMTFSVHVDAGPWSQDGELTIPMNHCSIRCRDGRDGERVFFDIERATGAAEGVIRAMAIDYCFEMHNGSMEVHQVLSVLRGPQYDRTIDYLVGSVHVGREMERLLRNQIHPFWHALRERHWSVAGRSTRDDPRTERNERGSCPSVRRSEPIADGESADDGPVATVDDGPQAESAI